VPYTQRIPLTQAEHARRAPGKQVMRLLRSIDFQCQTREEAEDVADELASLLPDPVRSRLGLIELLLNAIEHGNLEIGGARKGELLRTQRFDDELTARLADQRFRARRVGVTALVRYPLIEIEIRDEGPGFDWRSVLGAEVSLDGEPNGRGVALVAHGCFPGLEYRDPGNVALVKVAWPR
jgi:anti-sigma regulatory factor (Ser/Thr protein kinase)